MPFKRLQTSVEAIETLCAENAHPSKLSKKLSRASGIEARLKKLLKYSTFEPEERYWLDTGSPELNAALGSRTLGLPYGKIIELSGKEHSGKTALAAIIAGMGQKEGAGVTYLDLEDSRDDRWMSKLGLDLDDCVQIFPKLIKYKKKKKKSFGPKKDVATGERDDEDEDEHKSKSSAPELMLQSAELLFQETEQAMALYAGDKVEKQIVIVDSIANVQTELQVDAGMTDQNMRTRLDRAVFLAYALPRWAGLASNYNALIILINQLRDKQGLVFGKPTTTTGGRALKHACAIRAEVAPHGQSRLKKGPKIIGICGKVVNEKNKAGGGSEFGLSCVFKILWNRDPAKVSFMSLEDAGK